MTRKNFIFLLVLSSAVHIAVAQHIRGLSVLSDKSTWMSGSKGTVLKTTNGGKKWKNVSPRGYSRKDFRDIHAWNDKEAIIMSAGDSAVFLKTYDGGKSWRPVYVNNSKGIFFDAIDFMGDKGVAIGDPQKIVVYYRNDSFISTVIYFLKTDNRGEYWERPGYYVVPFDSTESLFAASGSNIQWIDTIGENPDCRFVTGGNQPRFLSPEGLTNLQTPILAGPGCGAYAFFMGRNGAIVAVGGNYKFPDKRDSCAVFSSDSGKTWRLCKTMPGGYRSGVCANQSNTIWVTTGTNGTDVSTDKGNNWKSAKIKGYNVCAFSKKYLWLAGNKGKWEKVKIGKIIKGR